MTANNAKILIIDENDDYRDFMRMLLEGEGYSVFTIKDGKEGVSLAKDIMPDCIVLDSLLPYISSITLAKELKADTYLKNIPVIFLTAEDSKDALLQSIESGVDDYVVKTNDFDIIIARVKAMLRLKKLQDDNQLHAMTLRHDLKCAGKIQGSILSHKKVDIPGINLIEDYRPHGEVTGDYYDIKKLDKNNYAVLMTDVAGHGIAASMLTLFIKSYFENNAKTKDGDIVRPKDFLSGLNTVFASEGFDSSFFSTAFYGIYNTEDCVLSFSKGGHPDPFLFRKDTGKIEKLGCKGILVGVVPDMIYQEKTVSLQGGDTLFIFTDGIFEVFGRKGDDIFGEERLEKIFSREMKKGTKIESIPDIIVKSVLSFSTESALDDDVTMLMINKQ